MRVLSRSALAVIASAALSTAAFAADTDSRFPQGPGVPPTGSSPAEAAYSEGFDNILTNGWTINNASVPLGTISWFQGNDTVFPAHSGASTSYAGVNFNSTTGANTINNWYISPALSVTAGDTVSFWTRTVDEPAFPDRLYLKLNTAGDLVLANFTTTLVSVNPGLTTVGYPNTWTQYSAVVPSTGTVRFAFNYNVPSGGPAGSNSDYIGVDTFAITEVPEPASLGLLGLGAIGMIRRRRA